MKLYEIIRGSKIYEKCSDGSKYFIFDHIDWAYSYCITEKWAVVHLGASQELKGYKDWFKFYEQKKRGYDKTGRKKSKAKTK
jgi:hypothetical protein